MYNRECWSCAKLERMNLILKLTEKLDIKPSFNHYQVGDVFNETSPHEILTSRQTWSQTRRENRALFYFIYNNEVMERHKERHKE